MACQAQLVNVIGLLRSEPGGSAWKQTIAYPFEQMRRLAHGQILQLVTTSDRYDSAEFSDVPVVDATATYDRDSEKVAIFVANRSLTETATLEVDLRGVGGTAVAQATTLHACGDQSRHADNATDHRAVVPIRFDDHTVDAGRLNAVLPALSWTVFEIDAPTRPGRG